MHPLVSIITPSFNSAATIERTIQSVLSQDYSRIEHIVVDGASSDGTVAILKRYPHLRWISEPDRGQSDALNKGFWMAQGEIIGWLNADDTYNLGAISAAVGHLLAHSETAMVYSHCNLVDEADRLTGVIVALPWKLERDLLEHRIPQPTAFIKAEALARVGYLDTSLHYVMDRDLFMRLGLCYNLDLVDATWANFRECPGTKTASNPERFWQEVLRVFDQLYALHDLPTGVQKVKAQAYARAFWMAGITLLAAGKESDIPLGQDYCRRAADVFPILENDLDFIAGQLTHWAVMKIGFANSLDDVFVHCALDCIPMPSHQNRRISKKILGQIQASRALMWPKVKDSEVGLVPGQRLHWIFSAIRNDRRWLWHRGVLILLIRDALATFRIQPY